MDAFVTWFKENWAFAFGFVAVCIAAFFVFKAAGKAYRRYYERYKKEEENIKRLLCLKERYKDLTEDVIRLADSGELLEGVALSYQLKLQKEENMEEAFSLLSKEKQYVYALDIFTQDKTAEIFFKENGKELVNIIVPALEMINLSDEAEKCENIRKMFDDTDESTSYNQKIIEETDKYFESRDLLIRIKESSAEFIKENPGLFV